MIVGQGPCAFVQQSCAVPDGVTYHPDPGTTTQAAVTDGAVTANCRVESQAGAAPAIPQITGAMLREQAEKLLPHPKIDTAPTGANTLINIETVLWIDTAADRTLGTVTLLGHHVGLRAHIDTVDWNFGDRQTDHTTDPGRAYTRADPCRTPQCPSYYGHTFRHTGRYTITATLIWTGRYQLDGGAWQTITQPVTAPSTAHPITVKQARGVLIPNP
jgi:hypothetical protein